MPSILGYGRQLFQGTEARVWKLDLELVFPLWMRQWHAMTYRIILSESLMLVKQGSGRSSGDRSYVRFGLLWRLEPWIRRRAALVKG
jgi:hypothetical protein